jgi:hypothetical protein
VISVRALAVRKAMNLESGKSEHEWSLSFFDSFHAQGRHTVSLSGYLNMNFISDLARSNLGSLAGPNLSSQMSRLTVNTANSFLREISLMPSTSCSENSLFVFFHQAAAAFSSAFLLYSVAFNYFLRRRASFCYCLAAFLSSSLIFP